MHDQNSSGSVRRVEGDGTFRAKISLTTVVKCEDGGRLEELKASIRVINSKLTGLDERLPPAKAFRPPLAADI